MLDIKAALQGPCNIQLSSNQIVNILSTRLANILNVQLNFILNKKNGFFGISKAHQTMNFVFLLKIFMIYKQRTSINYLYTSNSLVNPATVRTILGITLTRNFPFSSRHSQCFPFMVIKLREYTWLNLKALLIPLSPHNCL